MRIVKKMCFILPLFCFFLRAVGGNGCGFPTEIVPPGDPESAKARVVQISYRIGTAPVSSTTEQLNILQNQTFVQVDDALSPYAIQQSIKALYATQHYSQIHVYLLEVPDGVALTYQLFPLARIEEIVIIGVSDAEFRGALEQVLKSKPGGAYLPKVVKSDVDRIKQLCGDYGYFNPSVTVDEAAAEDPSSESETQRAARTRLTYQIGLGEASVIRELKFVGNAAIPKHRLNAVCRFSLQRPIYNRLAVAADVAAMQALYQKNSYPSATVEPTFFRGTGVLQFQIREGRQVQFNFVSDVGEVSLSLQDTFTEDIVSLINTASIPLWERRIRSYFKAAGYHGTTVHEKIVDAAEIQLTINPGMQYLVKAVTFTGNRAFSDAELLREMTMKPIGGFLRNLYVSVAHAFFQQDRRRFFYEPKLETDVQRLKILYAKAGYPKAAIRTTCDKQRVNRRPVGDISIHLAIVEEHKELIHRCSLRGNSALGTADLRKRLQSHLPFPQPNASLARKAYQDAILKAYYELGYIDAVVSATYLPETETPVFQVTGDFSDSLARGELPLDIRDAFAKHDRTLEEIFVAANIDNRWSLQDFSGNPRYTLTQRGTHLSIFEHGVLQFTVITEGERVAFGKFYFEGDTDVVKKHVLTREVAHLEGTLWTSEKLSRARQSLYSLGIFHGVQVERLRSEHLRGDLGVGLGIEEGFRASSLKTDSVLIKVEKQEPRTYSFSTGYSLAEGARLTGELTDSNFLFKRNIRGRLRGRLGWRGTLGYLFDATLTEPWLIGRTRGSLQVSGRRLEIDDNVRALQGSLILSRRISKSNYVDLRYSYRNLSQPVPIAVQGGGTESLLHEQLDPFRTTVSSLRLSWTYDSRVRYLNPTGGMLNALTLEYAGRFLRGETRFIKTTTDTRYYQKLVGGLVLATALRLGATTGLHSNRRAELISFERFWAGGGTTVRGYAERSLGPEDIAGIHRGDVQFIFNTELRFPIYSVVRGAFFFDAGNVWGSLADVETSTLPPSSVGIGVYLDFGALTGGVDYAFPFVSVPGMLDRGSAFHLRLGGTF